MKKSYKVLILFIISLSILTLAYSIKIYYVGEKCDISSIHASNLYSDDTELSLYISTTNSDIVFKDYKYKIIDSSIIITVYQVHPSKFIKNHGSTIRIHIIEDLSNTSWEETYINGVELIELPGLEGWSQTVE